jgi:hypothetical protein
MISPIDKIFQEIYGYIPPKSGTAYELFAAIATHIINGGEVKHDDRLRGEVSETSYQIDVHQIADGISTMGEAKDYSARNSKVGRGDLQKLVGALTDLQNVKSGTFFSPTGYTKPARQYASSADKLIGKRITLYNLKPSTEENEDDFIKTIIISLQITTPKMDQAKWIPYLTEKGHQARRSIINGESLAVFIDGIYDENKNELYSKTKLQQIVIQNEYKTINEDTKKFHFSFPFPEGCYILTKNTLIEIEKLEYEIPYVTRTQEIQITDDSKSRLILFDSNK